MADRDASGNLKNADMEGEKHSTADGSPKPNRDPGGITRRGAIVGIGCTIALLGLGGLRYAGHNPLRHPPGGQSEAHLVSACIRCERCYEACPRHVIKPARIEDGLLGMRAPTLDFELSYCDFCVTENGGTPRCVQVCPTGALDLASTESKDRVMVDPQDSSIHYEVHVPDLGLAVINTYECLAYRDTGCRFCHDACPLEPKAIELYGATGSTNPRVRVIADRCNGCGACESACVSLKAGSIASGATERAIVVHPVELTTRA